VENQATNEAPKTGGALSQGITQGKALGKPIGKHPLENTPRKTHEKIHPIKLRKTFKVWHLEGLLSSLRIVSQSSTLLVPSLQGQFYTPSPKAVKSFFSHKCNSLNINGEFLHG